MDAVGAVVEIRPLKLLKEHSKVPRRDVPYSNHFPVISSASTSDPTHCTDEVGKYDGVQIYLVPSPEMIYTSLFFIR